MVNGLPADVLPADMVTACHFWLALNPDAPLADRVAHALVIATNCDPDAEPDWQEVADVIDVSVADVQTAVVALRESYGVQT